MNDQDDEVARAVFGLMSDLDRICNFAETREGARLVRNEMGDLTVAVVRLGRLLKELSKKAA